MRQSPYEEPVSKTPHERTPWPEPGIRPPTTIDGMTSTAGSAPQDVPGAAQRVLDDPEEPGRIRRRQPDLMRLVSEILTIVVVVALGKIGVQTTSGVEYDVRGVELVPPVLLGSITVLMNIATAVIPVGVAVERLARRDRRRD